MQQKKCPGCGASVEFNENDGKVHKCNYCGSILTEEIEEDKKLNETFSSILNTGSRPKFNIFLCFFLIVIGGPIGIIYALIIFYLQSEWDAKNKK